MVTWTDSIFDVNYMTNTNHNTKTMFPEQEQTNKQKYMQRVLEKEHATPFIMATNSDMGGECEQFKSRLANKLAIKQDELCSTVKTWVRI